MFYLLLLHGALALATQLPCGCACVDGRALTLCSEVAAAQQGVNRCTAATDCSRPGTPAAPARIGAQPPLAPPPAGARNCRRAQLWQPSAQQQVPVAICDVTPD
jgi:hypothetical protein